MKKGSFEDFALKCFHVCIEVPKMQDQGCVVHAMPVRKIEKTLTSSVVCLSVRSASLKCWMDRRGAALDPRKWHVVYKHYELKHGKKGKLR